LCDENVPLLSLLDNAISRILAISLAACTNFAPILSSNACSNTEGKSATGAAFGGNSQY
jgi:hypothetical protein